MARGSDKNREWKVNAQDFMVKLGDKLRSRRRELQKSLRALETEVGLSRSMISLIERGKSDFSVSYLYNFAVALDISPSELIPNPIDMAQSSDHADAVRATQAVPPQTLKPG